MSDTCRIQTPWKTATILERLQVALDELIEQRQFRTLDSVHGINLCSNDYLGLSDDPRLKQAVIRAVQEGEGLCSTGSRLLSGNAPIWDQLEDRLASFVGAEASLVFSSGYMANVGLLSTLPNRDSTVFSDSANHASIIDGIRLSHARTVIVPHGDLNFLEDALRSTSGERFIVVESIFGMDGDRARLEDLYALSDRYAAGLIVDEAHATGVVGPDGRGLVAASGRPECVIATVHTCGKALASMGAFVACSATVRQYLINKARPFIFSTALAPYVAAQIMEAVAIVEAANDRRQHLHELSEFLRVELRNLGFDTSSSESHIVPVVLGSNETALRVAQKLVGLGFGVKAIRPPTVSPGTARLRLSLTARLTREQVAALIQALRVHALGDVP